MSAGAVLKDAAACGVRLSLNGDNLALKASAKPSAALLAKLKANKAEIVALLRQEAFVRPSQKECAPPEPDEVELEERKAMAMGSVPEPYLDAWTRLQCQRPRVSEGEWRMAIDDAGGFLDAWGSMAAEFGWTSGELFDVPHGDGTSGLIWFLKGEPVRSMFCYASGRVFERGERSNPYAAPIFPCGLGWSWISRTH